MSRINTTSESPKTRKIDIFQNFSFVGSEISRTALEYFPFYNFLWSNHYFSQHMKVS